MDSIRLLVQSVLIEGKVDELQARHPDIDVKGLAAQDPSPTKKYTPWAVKIVAASEDPGDRNFRTAVMDLIKDFHKNVGRLEKKDINSYASANDLQDALSQLDVSNRKKKEAVKAQGATKIFENDLCMIFYIKTKDACISYGANTKWCITTPGTKHWEQYTEDGMVFYFVISKNVQNPTPDQQDVNGSKFAIVIDQSGKGKQPTTAFDELDEEIDAEDVARRFGFQVSSLEADSAKRDLPATISVFDPKKKLPPKEEVLGLFKEKMASQNYFDRDGGTVEIYNKFQKAHVAAAHAEPENSRIVDRAVTFFGYAREYFAAIAADAGKKYVALGTEGEYDPETGEQQEPWHTLDWTASLARRFARYAQEREAEWDEVY